MSRPLLSVWLLCGAALIGLAPQAQAAPIVETFEFNWKGKDSCRLSSNSTQGDFVNFNNKNTPNHPSAAVTITRDSSAAGFQARLSFPPGADSSELELADISMTGVGFRANKSETSAEFVLHGVHATDSAVFYTMRGKASLDKTTRAIKSVSGTFIGTLKGDSGTEHCFDYGTFQTGKKLP